MKNKETKSITLKKLTIARIDPNMMKKVNGGDCLPTDHPSFARTNCPSTIHVY